MKLHRAEAIFLALVLLAAAAVRVGYFREARADPSFRHPAIDAGYNDDWARSIAVPGWKGQEHLPDPELDSRAYLRPPGYPWFLAANYAISGGAHEAPRVTQMILGLATILLAWTIARRCFGIAAGVAAALLAATSWSLVYWEQELHEPTLQSFLLLAAAFAVLRWSDRPGTPRALLAGAIFGLAALVRPNALLLAAVALVWMMPAARARGVRFLPSSAALAAAAALVIAPATIRNAVVAGELVLVTSNSGINLYMGNHEQADGTVTSDLPGYGDFRTCYDYPAIARAVERELGRPLKDSEISAHFTRKALAFVREHPGRFLRLLGRKALLFWGPDEISHNKVEELDRRNSGVLRRLPTRFPLLAAGALVGLVATARSRERQRSALLLAGFVAAWFLSVLPFFAAARYREPVVPLLAVLAGAAMGEVVALIRARRAGAALAWTGAFALALFAASSSPYDLRPNVHKWHMDRGRAWRKDSRPDLAVPEFERAIAGKPGSAEAHYSLALALGELGRPNQAVEQYRAAIAAEPGHADALNNLGSLLAQGGHLDEGLALLERAFAANPESAMLRANLERALGLAISRAEKAGEKALAASLSGRREMLRSSQ